MLSERTCEWCCAPLTDEEVRYYGYRCEGCERVWFDRVEEWRHGGEDKELDELYGPAPKPPTH